MPGTARRTWSWIRSSRPPPPVDALTVRGRASRVCPAIRVVGTAAEVSDTRTVSPSRARGTMAVTYGEYVPRARDGGTIGAAPEEGTAVARPGDADQPVSALGRDLALR